LSSGFAKKVEKVEKEADNAMYDAKINGKNTYVIREL